MNFKICNFLVFLLIFLNIQFAQAISLTEPMNVLCNMYWEHTGIIDISGFDKSGLDIEDSPSTSINVPLDVYCVGRPETLKNTSAYFNMSITQVTPSPIVGNDLVLTNTKSSSQIQVQACAGMKGGPQGLCVSTIGTPTSYVMPDDGDQKEIMDSLLGDSDEDSVTTDKGLCAKYPDDCSGTIAGFYHVGHQDHPYRLFAHVEIPQQKDIAPGVYQGQYEFSLKGMFSGAKVLSWSLIKMTINSIQPLNFRLKVSSACNIKSINDVTLPTTMFSSVPVTASVLANIRCTYGTPYTVTFDGIHDDSDGELNLQSSDGLHEIPYQITSPDGIQWPKSGNTFAGTGEMQDLGFNVSTISNMPDQPPDNYSDTVTMTVNYTNGT